MIDLDQLAEDLVHDEGERLKPYRCTAGKLTIGVGRNLDDRGITSAESRYLLRTDIAVVLADLDRHLPWWRKLSERRQRALANMCFQRGIGRLSGFKKALAALERGDYDEAAREALDSAWARQTPARAQRFAKIIKEG